MQNILTVIGKGFGDEGKGLATDYFCSKSSNALVIKHNGGAQAGHTVETDDKRFVFHQLSAGSFRNADTFWADTYYPDLYKLGEEIEEFRSMSGICPKIYCDAKTSVTLIDDVLINMLLELSRGDGRHGSCGMGINECDLRTKAGFGITVKDIITSSAEDVVKKIEDIRSGYGVQRLSELGLSEQSATAEMAELFEALSSKTVIENAVDEMKRNAEKYVTVCEDSEGFLKSRDLIVFETGQGLLLDSENQEFAPHVTASRTGLYNPCKICSKYGLKLTEVVYVTRSYVTRHGAGPLPYECSREDLGNLSVDMTNEDNPWQGSIRYARHGSVDEFLNPVRKDLDEIGGKDFEVSLFLTHLNETDNNIRMTYGDKVAHEFAGMPKVKEVFDRFYYSDSREN